MEDCNVHSAASILASVKEQEARFERLTRALEQERRHVALQLERAQQPGMSSGGMVGSGQPLPMAWQQLVLQEQSPGSQASLATMPEAPEVLEETVTVEEDPGTPTSHVSIVTSEDGTTRRTETKVWQDPGKERVAWASIASVEQVCELAQEPLVWMGN